MKKVMEPLLALQALELGPAPEKPENAAEITRLRQLVPPQILGHYDRLMVRGKKGVSVVKNGVCTECHMRLASGAFSQLLRQEDIMVCETCGRYLVPSNEPVPEAAPAEAPKKTRKRAKKTDAGALETPLA